MYSSSSDEKAACTLSVTVKSTGLQVGNIKRQAEDIAELDALKR
ncbi:hypothetical protein HMPREF9098_2057 [Kingella denitrificans ATCC 33394]|uniref:Uncharacterized protein n=1 Tax=Kingella denitrificans ATCC 33394 TaxID=888741 RepID=F0F1S2_9NEIS|nr:hypothetical protein HMPREF9098_2057 [Kingella denitrificans ATCC 33394]